MAQDEQRAAQSFDPGTNEVQAEAVDNTRQAEGIDAAFADRWTEHLQAACLKAVEDDPSERGVYEACRRAFREGFLSGARGTTLG